jgi:nucleoid-associated protein YgaU
MSPQPPKDSDLSLQPSTSVGGSASSPDFSNAHGHADTVPASPDFSPDFSNVQSHADTMPAGSGGGGSTGEQTYTVQPGDTLSHIAQKHYGKASHWHAIFAANRDQIDNPDLIHPGQVLKLPAN